MPHHYIMVSRSTTKRESDMSAANERWASETQQYISRSRIAEIFNDRLSKIIEDARNSDREPTEIKANVPFTSGDSRLTSELCKSFVEEVDCMEGYIVPGTPEYECELVRLVDRYLGTTGVLRQKFFKRKTDSNVKCPQCPATMIIVDTASSVMTWDRSTTAICPDCGYNDCATKFKVYHRKDVIKLANAIIGDFNNIGESSFQDHAWKFKKLDTFDLNDLLSFIAIRLRSNSNPEVLCVKIVDLLVEMKASSTQICNFIKDTARDQFN